MSEKSNQKTQKKRTYNEMIKNAKKLEITSINTNKKNLNEKEDKQNSIIDEKIINFNIFKKRFKTNTELSKNIKFPDEKIKFYNCIYNINKNIISLDELTQLKMANVKENENSTNKLIDTTKSDDNTIKNYNYNFSQNVEAQINEITLKIKIEQNEVNKIIYFLDNTQDSDGEYPESDKWVKHIHDNLREMNENNTILIIDEKTLPFKKFFIPKKSKIYSIKLILKIKLSNSAYMFCECNNIIDIDFSKFNTDNIISMHCMFYGCSSLKKLNLSSFNTHNVTDMALMFYECKSLTLLNLSSFNTQNVKDMVFMFSDCYSLLSLNLFNFNTKNVNDMAYMFKGCSSLTILNLSSFNTQNVTNMAFMFYGCSSLTILNLSSFNTENVTDMMYIFSKCYSLTKINLCSFNAINTGSTFNMFDKCINLPSCDSLDKNIVHEFIT